MRALVTGSQGFVGGYLRRELEQNGYEVTGIDTHPGEGAVQADLLDGERLIRLVGDLAPDAVFHLAGQADVARSWREPRRTAESNLIAAINLMEAVRREAPAAHMVVVGSSDQYGDLGAAGKLVSEDTPVRPRTPYGVTKLAQEQMAQVYVKAYGLHICMTRSFNHGGAGQREGFLIPDFAAGVVRVERGLTKAVKVGNLDSRRDFTHVKDVVRAYRLLAEKGRPGEVYNVGSGVTYSAREILDRLCAMASCPIPVEADPARLRPSDTPVICCDHAKLTAHTGWQPALSIDEILSDTLTEWRGKSLQAPGISIIAEDREERLKV